MACARASSGSSKPSAHGNKPKRARRNHWRSPCGRRASARGRGLLQLAREFTRQVLCQASEITGRPEPGGLAQGANRPQFDFAEQAAGRNGRQHREPTIDNFQESSGNILILDRVVPVERRWSARARPALAPGSFRAIRRLRRMPSPVQIRWRGYRIRGGRARAASGLRGVEKSFYNRSSLRANVF